MDIINFPSSKEEAIKLGLNKYFDGKPCYNGHISPKYINRNQCVVCIRKTTIKYRKENPEKYKEDNRKLQNKRLKNPINKLHNAMSTAVYLALKGDKNGRGWENLVGYSKKELYKHLESKFKNNMSWNNYGKYWEIDHIKPLSLCASFSEAWQLSNLQPLEKLKNKSKGNRYIG